jgi:hypothetical protein
VTEPENDPTRHTWEVLDNQEKAEQVTKALRERGWTIYRERVPLHGQSGFYCTRTEHDGAGESVKVAHSVRWNLYGKPLRPIAMDAENGNDLLMYLMHHARHPGFEFVDLQDGDLGFVCHCTARVGYSLSIRITRQVFRKLPAPVRKLLLRRRKAR